MLTLSRLRGVLGALLTLTFPSDAATQQRAETSDPFARVHVLIEEGIAQGRGISLVAAVARNGEIVWEESFGWADRERAIRATSRTLYPIGSITKSMTATAVMILAEAGLVDLDAPANSYLPAGARFRVPTGEESLATVRRVLVHTAGLPKYWRFIQEGNDDALSKDQLIRRYATVVFPPGARYNYSNIGYAVLARIVEHQTGAEYATVLKERVIEPLGLHDTRLEVDLRQSDEVAALYDAMGHRIPRYVTGHGGASGIWTTAHDLALYGMFHLHTGTTSPAILSVEGRAAMREPLSVHPEIGAQGIGWFHRTEGDRAQYFYTGGMPGAVAALLLEPETRTAVAVLTNQDEVSAAALARTIASWATRGRPPQTSSVSDPSETSASTQGNPPERFSGSWRGVVQTHEGDIPMELNVDPDGSSYVRVGNAPHVTLLNVEVGDGGFSARAETRLPTSDAMRHAHVIDLLLQTNAGDELSGQLTALTPGQPAHFALSHYVVLTREGGARR